MTDIFEDSRSITFSPRNTIDVEFYLFDDRRVSIESREDSGWDLQRVSAVISPAEATALREFLTRHGY